MVRMVRGAFGLLTYVGSVTGKRIPEWLAR